MAAQIAEAQSKVQAAEADRLQAEAQLAAAQSTYDAPTGRSNTWRHRGQRADSGGKTSGRRQGASQFALQANRAAESAVRALQDLQGYLKILAPFDGVVTDRMIHPGALVGPGNDSRFWSFNRCRIFGS